MTADVELPVDLADAIAVGFAGGAIGTLGSTGSVVPHQEEMLEIRVFGSDGHVIFDVNAGRATIHRPGPVVRTLADVPVAERYPERAPALDLVAVETRA